MTRYWHSPPLTRPSPWGAGRGRGSSWSPWPASDTPPPRPRTRPGSPRAAGWAQPPPRRPALRPPGSIAGTRITYCIAQSMSSPPPPARSAARPSWRSSGGRWAWGRPRRRVRGVRRTPCTTPRCGSARGWRLCGAGSLPLTQQTIIMLQRITAAWCCYELSEAINRKAAANLRWRPDACECCSCLGRRRRKASPSPSRT